MTEAENDDDIKLCFSIDEGASLLNETGYRKAVCSLKLSDRPAVLGALLDYHLMIKVKAEMDQFKEGLQTLGYLEALQSNPSIWQEYFLYADVLLTAGMYVFCVYMYVTLILEPPWNGLETLACFFWRL